MRDRLTDHELEELRWREDDSLNHGRSQSAAVGTAAVANFSSLSTQGSEILTPTRGTVEEFLVYTPEPSILILLVFGLLGVAIVWHKKPGI